MGKLSIVEKMIYAAQHDEPMPLKGRARIILEDVRDGRIKTIESDNIVTNAVASILQRNYGFMNDFRKLLPLRDLYNGVLCFQGELTESAGAYNMPNDITAPLIAHAGSLANNTGSTLRGSPVTNEYVYGQTSIKMVWLWDNTQGNGTINTVCLCPDALGNMGTKPYDATMNCWSSLALENEIGGGDVSTLTRTAALRRPISIADDGKTGKAIWWDIANDRFEEITVRHDWLAFGIMRDKADVTVESQTIPAWQEVTGSSRIAETREFTLGKASLFEDDDYYWLYQAESATKLKIDKISKTDFSRTSADITYTGTDFYTGTAPNLANPSWMLNAPRFAYDGEYLYFPNSSLNGFEAVNPSNNSDRFTVDGTVSVNFGIPDTQNSAITPLHISRRLIYGENYLINGSRVYPIKMVTPVFDSETIARRRYMDAIRKGASVYCVPYRGDTYGTRGQGAALLKFFLSTVNVLPEEVVKSTSQTMRVEYTLTEVG